MRRRLSELRDRLHAQFNTILDEPDEMSVVDNLQSFNGEGARLQRRTRGRQITFKVVVLHNAITRYRSRNDTREPISLAVSLDLTPEAFFAFLRANVPGVPEDFELCRLTSDRQIVPLIEQCPLDIRNRNALNRSNLYLRPKIVGQPGVPSREGSDRSASPQRRPVAQPGVPSREGSDRSASPQRRPVAQPGVPSREGSDRSASPQRRPVAQPGVPSREGSDRSASPQRRPVAQPGVPSREGSDRSASPQRRPGVPSREGSDRSATPQTRPVAQPGVPSREGSDRSATPQTRPVAQPGVPSREGSDRSASPQRRPVAQPGVPSRHDFYIDDDDVLSESDVEEVFNASPQQDITYDNVGQLTLSELIYEFQSTHIDRDRPLPIVVRRRKILRSACTALGRSYFEWQREPRVEFLNEFADDYGGPRREFLRLLLIEIQGAFGVFEGHPKHLFFTFDLQALDTQKYFNAGKLTAWSVAHGGPGPRSINKALYKLMCGQSAPLVDLDIGVLLDMDQQEKLQQLKTCASEEDLQTLKASCGDWVSGCGVPTFFSASLEELPQVIERVVANFCFHRVASMAQQYISGMNACGRFFDLVTANWEQFIPIFCSTEDVLTRQAFKELFTITWSPEGSNRREEEEDTIFQYEDWLVKVEEGDVDTTFEDLLVFVTGADHPPALGFDTKCQIIFYDQEPRTRRLPYASTCALHLYLPRGVGDEEDFGDMMSTALVGSLGFGKV